MSTRPISKKPHDEKKDQPASINVEPRDPSERQTIDTEYVNAIFPFHDDIDMYFTLIALKQQTMIPRLAMIVARLYQHCAKPKQWEIAALALTDGIWGNEASIDSIIDVLHLTWDFKGEICILNILKEINPGYVGRLFHSKMDAKIIIYFLENTDALYASIAISCMWIQKEELSDKMKEIFKLLPLKTAINIFNNKNMLSMVKEAIKQSSELAQLAQCISKCSQECDKNMGI
ncbi:MAG: hypothetical protein LBI69_00950 [Puniceicoccales bacterium]|nr:hypothetical protein [Puniceicoccales bacterium]